jgi:hypothetical protein
MESSLGFDKTIYQPLSPVPSQKDVESTWEKTMQLYEQGKFKDSVLSVIDYANAGIRKKFGNPEQSIFRIPHGSAQLLLSLENDTFFVEAPFLKLPEAKIPLMRRITEINFGTLSIAQIILKEDDLYFTFSCPLELCYPYKVYEVLREICSNADYFDDEFVDQFGALRTAEPIVFPMDASKADLAFNKLKQYLAETEQYIAFFESKRMEGYMWDLCMIQFRKIEYYMCPQGKLRNDLEKAIADLNNGYVPFPDRMSNARKFITWLQSLTKEQVVENLYTTEVFIPYKYFSRIDNIKNNFTRTLETATNEMNNNDFIGSTFTLQGGFMDLFYNNNLSPDVAGFCEKALLEASGKPWKESAQLLAASMKKLTGEGDILSALTASLNMN